jgi:hypothetical protein
MRRVGAIAHISLWLVMLAMFFYVAAPQIYWKAPRGSVAPIGDPAFHSTNSFLHYATGEDHASQKLISLVRSATPQQRLLILDHEDDPKSSLIGMVSAYLTWPHPVEMVDLVRTRANRPDVIQVDRTPPAAIIFCRLGRPSDLSEGTHLGRGMEIVPIAMK